MEKYHGVPLLGRAPRRHDFQYLVEKVQSKLSAWKAKQLSLAGRITPSKAVLEAVPIYPMMSNWIPRRCLRDIQQLQCNFIWGDEVNHRRIHLIRWKTLLLPRQNGELGLHDSETVNKACIMKRGWSLRVKKDTLWSKVLWGKYGRNQQLEGPLIVRNSDSHLWRQIANTWKKLEEHVWWAIGKGTAVNVWQDCWLAPGVKLGNCGVDIPRDLFQLKVAALRSKSRARILRGSNPTFQMSMFVN